MRKNITPRHARFARSALGLLSAVGLAVATATLASPGNAATPPAAHSPASAPMSGHHVRGAVYGQAAVRRAGKAADRFRTLHSHLARRPGGRIAPLDQLHDWWGSFPNPNSGTGLMATQSVDPNLRLSDSNDVLYTPTMKPPDGSCIEVVTVHTTSTPQVWAWDWCGSVAPAAELNVDSSFMSTYTKTVNGRSAYTVQNVQTDPSSNTWTASLYNQQTGAWDTLFTSSGTDQSGLTQGWDMFEFYSDTNPSTGNTYVCGDIAADSFESSSIQIQNGGSWAPLDPSNSAWQPSDSPDPNSYQCPSLVFQIVANNSDWVVSESH